MTLTDNEIEDICQMSRDNRYVDTGIISVLEKMFKL